MNSTADLRLVQHDLQWCLRRTPRRLLEAMQKRGQSVFVAGGFIRSCISNEPINDIDCFASSKDEARALAMELADDDSKRLITTDNAFTVRGYGTAIQVIHRWTFDSPRDAMNSFDFTIARAAFWWEPHPLSDEAGKWVGAVDARFYADLAGKRLVYCQPIRNEDAGGSMLRVLKFYQRGYRIPLDSLGAVIARLVAGVEGMNDWELVSGKLDEYRVARILSGLLREVDPNIDPSHIAHLPSEEESTDTATPQSEPMP